MSQSVTLTPERQLEKDEINNNVSTKIQVIQHKVKRRILLFGLSLSTVCAVFPAAAFTPALGLIALDLNGYGNISWYMTSFYLGSSIFQLLPIKMSNCFGRRRLYLFGIIFMSIASLVACFSVNSYMLIAMRACQGICCGILQTLSIAVIIDLFPLEKRILYLSNNAIAFGFASTVGPMIGGVIADKLAWRYIFAFNLILAIPVAVIVYFFVEIPTKPEQKISIENCKTICSRLDAGGCIIVTIGIVCFLLSVNFASVSRQYSWSSPIVIGLLVGSFSSIVGNILVIPALLLIAFVETENSSVATQIGILALYAVGFGCVSQGTNIGSQLILEQVAPRLVASSTAIIRFLLQFGLGVMSAVFFSIMNSEVGAHLESLHQTDPSLYQRVIASGAYRDYVKISTIKDQQVQATLNSIYFKSISKVYYVLMGLCIVANVCILLVRIPKMPEKKSKKADSTDN